MLTEIRFQENIRPREAACAHKSAANNSCCFCSSPPNVFPGWVLLQYFTKILDLSGFGPSFWWECGKRRNAAENIYSNVLGNMNLINLSWSSEEKSNEHDPEPSPYLTNYMLNWTKYHSFNLLTHLLLTLILIRVAGGKRSQWMEGQRQESSLVGSQAPPLTAEGKSPINPACSSLDCGIKPDERRS